MPMSFRCAAKEFRERFGNGGRRLAEPGEGLLIGVGDFVEGEADDAAERLGVKQDDAPSHPESQRQARVGEKAADQLQAGELALEVALEFAGGGEGLHHELHGGQQLAGARVVGGEVWIRATLDSGLHGVIGRVARLSSNDHLMTD
ncbi:hypothetical protein JW592_07425 [Streptomyces sp. DW4-2]|uniref:Uncharacterized protein n=1 Tax=Streptomyces spirodelae TaxID=2812904 RepID=A0ABS3WQ94_9ACTN|nr:hypothetical protein [Streptomyces spirodelae]